MTEMFGSFRICAMPNKDFDRAAFFEVIGRNTFVLVYDFSQKSTLLLIDTSIAKEKTAMLIRSVPGLALEVAEFDPLKTVGEMRVVSFYKKCETHEKLEETYRRNMQDIFDLDIESGFVAVAFVPAGDDELERSKRYIEDNLSKKEVRETHSESRNGFAGKAGTTTQRELFAESEETELMNCVLASMNDAVLSNSLAYKQFLIMPKNYEMLREYIRTRFLLLDERDFRTNLTELLCRLAKEKAFPLGTGYLSSFVNIYGTHRLSYILPTVFRSTKNGIKMGNFMNNGVVETNYAVRIDPSTINLGFILTGLPGSGKTREAMAIIDEVKGYARRTRVVVIAPTDEWDAFATDHEMHLIKPYADNVPINLFRCPSTTSKERFYENLATMLASASNAGPYQNPLEHCMLNAFRKAYAETDTPDPAAAYDAIEEAIIQMHAKRTNTGVKYTKHGENIRSALEGLRAILCRQEYSAKEGIRIEELADRGAVFDLSSVSSGKRAYLYALLLNQIYALTSSFDTKGDDELRLLVCLEEAQTVFGSRDSAAVQDLRQHIQDFRKQGIGLMLLVHSISDIEQGVRRLCQTKLYLKQAPDVAAMAANDLIFTYAREEDIALKLKLLESRTGAFSYVAKDRDSKSAQDTIFIKTANYRDRPIPRATNETEKYLASRALRSPAIIDAKLNIECDAANDKEKPQKNAYHIRLSRLGEELSTHRVDCSCTITQRLIEGSEYTLQLRNMKGKMLGELKVKACPEISICIRADAIYVA
jgi:hypothetical protein